MLATTPITRQPQATLALTNPLADAVPGGHGHDAGRHRRVVFEVLVNARTLKRWMGFMSGLFPGAFGGRIPVGLCWLYVVMRARVAM